MPGANYVKVFLDGKEVERCIFLQGADSPGEEVKGHVVCLSVDKYGAIVLDGNFEPSEITKPGMVRWEWSGEESYAKYKLKDLRLEVKL